MVWINELHYDNVGTDTNEFVEIAGLAGTDLSRYALVLYNGSDGQPYRTLGLTGTLGSQQNGFGTVRVAAVDIQNGSPDAVALVELGAGAGGADRVVQFLSYEGSFMAMGGPAAGLTSTDIGVSEATNTPVGTSLQLVGTGNSYADFTWAPSAPETSGAVNAGQTFEAPDPAPRIAIANAAIEEGDADEAELVFTVTRSGDASVAFTVDYATADGTATAGEDYEGVATGRLTFAPGETSKTIRVAVTGDTTFEADETFTVVLSNATGGVTIDGGTATGTIRNDDIVRIFNIQGAGHVSEYVNQAVTTRGVVTAVGSNGFYLQDAAGDGNVGTSDGIFVFTGSRPTVAVGNELRVSGTVQEFLPGNDPGNLTITQIVSPTITVTAASVALPAATVIGTGGRLPPGTVIDDDGLGSYDPATDGIDFYESLEGMRVQVNNAVAVGPTNNFGEIAVVADNGGRIEAGDRTLKGGIRLEGDPATGEITDANPERIIIDDVLVPNEPAVNTGATFAGPVTGVLSYSFGNYKLLNTTPLQVATNPTVPETTRLTGDADHLTVATFNVENLDPRIEDVALVDGRNPNNVDDDTARFTRIAEQIFENLKAPDIVALQEVQDNSGAENEDLSTATPRPADVTRADATLTRLVDTLNAFAAAEGSSARFAFIDNPFVTDDASGGQPGANIRNAFIYRTDRVEFVEGSLRTIDGDGTATTEIGTNLGADQPFFQSRLPLVGTFRFNGEEVTLVNNHFSSKGGDDALFGSAQPPFEFTEAQRLAQAEAVRAYVDARTRADADAKVVVLGDLNDFEFSDTLNVLTADRAGAAGLNDLITQLPENDRYDYIFEGNSQVLDHVLVSDGLLRNATIDAVHINADFAASLRTSDHDPLVARLAIAADRTLDGTRGNDTLRGGDGDDTLNGGRGRDSLFGRFGDDTLSGGEGDDLLDGGEGDDRLGGDAGRDQLLGGEGDDALEGGDGNDLLAGEEGDDTLAGGSGNDELFGDEGDDRLEGGRGNDRLDGGEGADTYVFKRGDGRDTIAELEAQDRIDLSSLGFGSAAEVLALYNARSGVLDLGRGDRITIEDGTLTAQQIQVTTAPAKVAYTLQILHASDLEGGIDALDRADDFAALVDYLEDTFDNSILLSAGDNFIPGPFFNAAGDPSLGPVYDSIYEQLYGLAPGSLNLGVGVGRADVTLMNVIGFDASALGNHEFDAGTSTLSTILAQNATWPGVQFPYLSANLDFSGDPNLRSLATNDIRLSTDFKAAPGTTPLSGSAKIAPATIIEEGGERIGVVGATTPLLESISSPGFTQVKDPGAGTNDMAALASILQPVIDQILAQGVNKVVLVSHLQQFALEQQLAPLLSGVDVIIAGGSSTLLADEEDVARGLQPGDTPNGTYPFVATNKDGDPTLIVSSDDEYQYVGRLVVDFDAEGRVIAENLDPTVSGSFAATEEVVAGLYGSADPYADGSKADLVRELITGVEAVVTAQDSNIIGRSDVYIEGRRNEVRTQETNLGNLSADANLFVAQDYDDTVLVSIKNGGGIRDSIGTIVETSPGVFEEVPPQANPEAGKEVGDVSQLDIVNALRFNNKLSLVTVTPEQLLQVLEHGVRASGDGLTPGQFPQVGGLAFSFDDDRPAGDRVVSVALIDENGNPTRTIVENGAVVADAPSAIRVVTLDFLASGGDGYPFASFIAANPAFANRVDLTTVLTDPGLATFAAPGSEQDALAEYFASAFGFNDPADPADDDLPFGALDTGPALDERIQNLDFREDTVLI